MYEGNEAWGWFLAWGVWKGFNFSRGVSGPLCTKEMRLGGSFWGFGGSERSLSLVVGYLVHCVRGK